MCDALVELMADVIEEKVEKLAAEKAEKLAAEKVEKLAVEKGDKIRTQGAVNKMLELVSKKLAKGKTAEQIADDLEETVENIQRMIESMAK